MKRLILVLGFSLASLTPAFAQSGGSVTIQAVDPSTGATVGKVGSASDNSLKVHIVASDVSSAGGTSAADGATYVAGTTSGTALQGARDDTSPGTVAEDKLGIVRITTNRAMHSNLRDASGNELLGSKTSAASVPVVIASDQGALPVSQSGTWTLQPGNTANTTPWLVKAGPYDGCGTTTYDPSSVKIPDATLDTLTSTTTCVETIAVTNIGSTQETITVQDQQGTPVQFLNNVPVAPGATMVLNNLGGLKFSGGIKYQASTLNKLSIWVKGRQ